MKKLSLLLASALMIGGVVNAQRRCETDEVNNRFKAQNPKIAVIEAQIEKEIQQRIAQGHMHQFAKGTGLNFDTIYHVPVVFHIVHTYGDEYVSDNQIYGVVADMNQMYSATNPDSVGIVPSYSGLIPGTNTRYRGKANIQFHLATKDPQGNPTHGITRRFSYQATNGGDNSKFDLWAPDAYLNIWLINTFSGAHTGAAAYAYIPASAATNPYGDGVITIVQPGTGNPLNSDHTISHEVGHVFNLQHPFGSTNSPQIACGDDGVDDTPPTKGHYQPPFCVPANLYDTVCSKGYSKTYSWDQFKVLYGVDSLLYTPNSQVTINYPDTVNSQNVMDYTYCSKMFTYGQVVRMRAALNSPTAGRSTLISNSNLIHTGVLDASGNFIPFPDLPPTADFSVNRPFVCADGNATSVFTNRSWNDTVTDAAWTFSNGATNPTSNSLTSIQNSFTQPGWVTATLVVTGNNGSGTGTITKSNLVYAADPTPVNPDHYYMSFEDSNEAKKWPIFNYFGTDHKWEYLNTVGVDNNFCIRFRNVDVRPYTHPSTQTYEPSGNYADFYSRAFDLSNITASDRLTFAYAGAYRTTKYLEMNDRLLIAYSTDCGANWQPLDSITRGDIGTAGYILNDFAPGYNQWKYHGSSLDNVAGSDRVFFRFRFLSGVDNIYNLFGTGNHFYMDRININSDPLGIDPAALAANGIILAPNPTSGSATVTIKGGDNSTAQVHVMDITGKLVYSAEARLSSRATQVVIPAERIAVKGMYVVEVITNGKALTQKLTVY